MTWYPWQKIKKKQPNQSTHLPKVGKIANPGELRVQSQVTFKGQMYFFPPVDFIRNEDEVTHTYTHTHIRRSKIDLGK